jgi:3-oxoacyl-[acyl-carrier-protein] synthase II
MESQGIDGSSANYVAYPMKRCVVTGIGVVSPIGTGLEKFWANLLAGETGVDKITQFDASTFPTQIAAEVKDFIPEEHLTKRETQYYSRMTQFAVAAAKMAIRDADIATFDPFRTGVLFGSATSAFEIIEENARKYPEALKRYSPDEVDPLSMSRAVIHGPSAAIALLSGAKSYVSTIASACSSGINAIGLASQRIQDGREDIMIAGGGDTPISYFLWSGFCAARFLTTNADPKDALCPFDARRTKGTFGEGAGVLILEEERHARARGATIYAEISSFFQASENTNELFMLDTSGEKWSEIMRHAFGKRKKFDYISAHGPSDKVVDKAEITALKNTLGADVAEQIPISSIKGAVGSGMATAGALQMAAATMTLKTGEIPPLYNYKDPDADFAMDFVKERRHKNDIKTVLVNGKGIGGVTSHIIMEKYRI